MSSVNSDFELHRAELSQLAYRMLGSLSDADDVLQEAYLRWSRDDRSDVKSPQAYLRSIVTRLCVDQRRAVEARKEQYVGPWLPEPIVESADAPGAALQAAESISLAFLVVLESLSPLERAAYLLRRVFDCDYAEIADTLGRTEASCRQLVSRAERHVRQRRPRFAADRADADRMADAFVSACQAGDYDALVRLLADDAVAVSDGGGKVPAALAPIAGADRIARLYLGLMKQAPANLEIRRVLVNGMPGRAMLLEGAIVNLLALDVREGKIAACYNIRNPEKLARVALG